MKARVVVLGDEPLVTGMRLAGMEHCYLAKEEDYEEKLSNLLKEKDVAVIITNQSFFSNISWRAKRLVDSLAYPVVVPLPDIGMEGVEEEELKKLIKRALGFELSG